jgi:hypothetical protein
MKANFTIYEIENELVRRGFSYPQIVDLYRQAESPQHFIHASVAVRDGQARLAARPAEELDIYAGASVRNLTTNEVIALLCANALS